MFCSKCGLNNKDGAKFCTGCGAELVGDGIIMNNDGTIVCPYCKSDIDADSRKCRYCGEWIKRTKIMESKAVLLGYVFIVFAVIFFISSAKTPYYGGITYFACAFAVCFSFLSLFDGIYLSNRDSLAYINHRTLFIVVGIILLLFGLIVLTI